MKYELSSDGPRTVLHVHDEMIDTDRHEFDAVLNQILAGGARQVDVDLEGLHYMDSAGLGMLLTLRDRVSKAEGEVTISHPEGYVKELLESACFEKLFTFMH